MSASAPSNPEIRSAAALRLPADLGIEHVAALRDELAAQLDATPLALDAGDVSRLHAAALQLLAAFCRERRDAGRATNWRAASATLRDGARVLGLGAMLDLDGVTA